MHNINREIQIEVEADVESWMDWAYAHGIHPLFVAFAKYAPAHIFDAAIPREPAPWCTPRSYVKFYELMHVYTNGNIDAMLSEDALAVEMGTGMIGQGAATEALAFMKVAGFLPTIEKIVADPKGAAKSLPSDRMDVMYAASSMVIHHINDNNAGEIFEFVTSLPKEMQVATLVRSAEKAGAVIATVPGWADWISKNQALVNASF